MSEQSSGQTSVHASDQASNDPSEQAPDPAQGFVLLPLRHDEAALRMVQDVSDGAAGFSISQMTLVRAGGRMLVLHQLAAWPAEASAAEAAGAVAASMIGADEAQGATAGDVDGYGAVEATPGSAAAQGGRADAAGLVAARMRSLRAINTRVASAVDDDAGAEDALHRVAAAERALLQARGHWQKPLSREKLHVQLMDAVATADQTTQVGARVWLGSSKPGDACGCEIFG